MEVQLLTIEQAASIMSLGKSKTYKMVANGELPSVRIGKALRVPRKSLDEWIERQVEKAESCQSA